jgi:hypothetical protein
VTGSGDMLGRAILWALLVLAVCTVCGVAKWIG